ncbi:hypothetical protein J6590_073348 [Homalodisca vitripennis]|nr:hypothetical protein J6590_073348 [Homalodisca vitripennis]
MAVLYLRSVRSLIYHGPNLVALAVTLFSSHHPANATVMTKTDVWEIWPAGCLQTDDNIKLCFDLQVKLRENWFNNCRKYLRGCVSLVVAGVNTKSVHIRKCLGNVYNGRNFSPVLANNHLTPVVRTLAPV